MSADKLSLLPREIEKKKDKYFTRKFSKVLTEI